MVRDGASIFLVLLPVLVPIGTGFGLDPVSFGVLFTRSFAIGQFTSPRASNLTVPSKTGWVKMESTVRWVIWMVVSMLGARALAALVPAALWSPRARGF